MRLRKLSSFPEETPSALRAPQPLAFPFQFPSSQVRPNHCPMWAPRGNDVQVGLCNAQPSVEVSGGLSYHFPHPPSLSCLEPRRHQSGQFINVLLPMTAWVGGHRQQREGGSGGSILGRFGGPRTRGSYQGVTDSTRALQGTEIRTQISPGTGGSLRQEGWRCQQGDMQGRKTQGAKHYFPIRSFLSPWGDQVGPTVVPRPAARLHGHQVQQWALVVKQEP